VEVNLYYQTTSREYIEFLRNEINGTGNLTLTGTGAGGDPAYVVSDIDHPQAAFFSGLRAWGDTIWNLWTHNMNIDGASPFLMAQGVFGTPATCDVSPPTLTAAIPGHSEVTLEWTAITGATGYNVYYDQAGKSQFIADVGNTTSYIDSGLSNAVEYCYKVTAYSASCESGFSNIVCAVPTTQGQATDPAGVSTIATGIYTGKGKSKTYAPQSTFNAGDGVVIRVVVLDGITGLPVAGATVDLLITGPESLTLTTGQSDASGIAETTWQTKAPGRKNPGTASGTYKAETKGITATGYHWDGVATSVTFTIQ
jgi:hypothetical protein